MIIAFEENALKTNLDPSPALEIPPYQSLSIAGQDR